MSKETSYPGRQDFIYLRQRVGGRKKNFLIEKSKGLQVKFLENTASYFKLVKDCHMARGLGLFPMALEGSVTIAGWGSHGEGLK